MVHQCPCAVELPSTGRSMCAAADAIGAWRFDDGLYLSAVPGPAVRSPTADNHIGSRSISDGSRFYDLFFIEKHNKNLIIR